MKKITGLVVLFLGLSVVPVGYAVPTPTIAIIDTAVDTSLADLKPKIVYEVCIMDDNKCPNGKSFQEGAGAATLPATSIYQNGFDHGTYMSQIASKINSNTNIVFIRIVPMTTTGQKGFVSENVLQKSLEWIAANKTKYNIVAASFSMGHHNLKAGSAYCPINTVTQNDIIKLQALDVATVVAVGNGYDYARIDYPACIPQAVAIGATETTSKIALYSNYALDLDFYSLGDYILPSGKKVGTSASAVAFASYWAKNYQGTYKETYTYMQSIMKSTDNTKVKTNAFINVLA